MDWSSFFIGFGVAGGTAFIMWLSWWLAPLGTPEAPRTYGGLLGERSSNPDLPRPEPPAILDYEKMTRTITKVTPTEAEALLTIARAIDGLTTAVNRLPRA